MKIRNLTIVFVMILIVSILTAAEKPKIEWEYIKGGLGKATVQDATFDEVWEKTLDILMFGKFKMKGAPKRSTHDATTVEKDAGLIVINGVVEGLEQWVSRSSLRYVLKVIVREKENHVEINLNCSSTWKKEVIKEFFQLYEEALKDSE